MFEFRHPHIETTINDNSYVNESATSGSSTSVLLQPYFSEKGEDNVIKKWNNLNDFLDKNGTPIFKKHGQAIYNLTAWLANAPVYGIRLMPEDATYGNLVLSLGFKQVAGDDGNNVVMTTRAQSVKNLKDKTEFATAMKTLDVSISPKDLATLGQTETTVISGQTPSEVKPISSFDEFNFVGFRVKGRGSYGNDYSIRIKANNSKSKSTEYRCYDLSIISTSENGTTSIVEGPYTISFNPKATNLSGTSLFIETIVNSYSNILQCVFDEDRYNAYISKLSSLVSDFDESKFDIIFGKDEDMVNHKGVTLFEGSVAIDQASGVSFAEGSNGQLDTATSSKDRLDVMNKLYLKAFSGELVKEVLNKRSYPFDVILDANFPINIKNQILTLCKTRQDCFPYFDAGLSSSYSTTSVLNFRKTDFDTDTYLGALFGPSRVIKDPYGIGSIEVTFTYNLASKIPVHDLSMGCQFPIAGPNYGTIGTVAEGELSFNPDEYQQEDLYNSQINYVTTDVNSLGEIGSQLTLQKKLSSLSDINNVRALLKIVRTTENIAAKYKFEFSDDITITSFQADLDNLATVWVDNRACTNLRFSVYQTDYDKLIKTTKVKVELVFNKTMETIIIDVNVGN